MKSGRKEDGRSEKRKENKAWKAVGMESAVVKERQVALSLFAIFWGVMLAMSGVHMGLLVLMSRLGSHEVVMSIVPIVYWGAVAAVLTLYVRKKMRDAYAEPLHRMAEATKKVAGGDFSVYVPPMHTADKLDYVDVMLSDFNKMVEELGSIETLKTDFFSNVSHEIKTPLAIIQNNAELLRMDELTEKQQEQADAVFWAAKRLSDLITNILKLSKLEKQTILPEMKTYDLCTQLADCALNFEQMWEKRELEFEADMEDRVMVTADPALMELVWNNLFSNAVKFTEPGGRILLTEVSDEKEIRVSVSDTGCGMTEETKKHIFDKFYQGDTSHAMAGNGLGLALALRVLQLNDFKITVESEPGKGSTFTVIIPRKEKTGGMSGDE